MTETDKLNQQLVNSITQLTLEIQSLQGKIGNMNPNPVYTNKTLLDLLQINTSTLRKYRDEGLIGYSKVGDKYYYSSDDVKKFLKQSHFEPFAY